MPNGELRWSESHAELLMDITASLALYTQKPQDIRHIPALLGRTLNLQPISFALVGTVAGGSTVLHAAYSHSPVPARFEQDLLDIHRQTRPLSTLDGPTLRPAFEPTEVDMAPPAAYPCATVFTHSLDDGHRMLLIIHHAVGEPRLSAGLTEILQLVTRQLGKLLECLIPLMAGPKTLGRPFDRLTNTEWRVLGVLNTEAAEKQLADQMHLSPHTLHTHIKSIYRKVGVRGRLPLLLRADDALRTLRLNRMHAHYVPILSLGNHIAVA